jgi:transposase, IS30 family
MEYSQLTLDDRINIYIGLQQRFTLQKIANQLEKHKATISREVNRNSGKKGYRFKQAHRNALLRKINSKKHIRLVPKIQKIIERKLKQEWSPEQISGWLGETGYTKISHETIYKMVYFDRDLGGSLYKHLRQSNKKRRKSYGTGKSQKGSIKNRVSIKQRPKIVDEQRRIGDLEGDTIIGKSHKGSIITLVDRKSLYLKMHLLKDRTSESVSKSIKKMMGSMKDLIHTITFDNGKEFAMHEEIASHLNVKVFFADPYSFWQRAINENMNGLIRQYIPKKTDFSTLTQKDIALIERKINNRPRKKLGFKTPYEVFWGTGICQHSCNLKYIFFHYLSRPV